MSCESASDSNPPREQDRGAKARHNVSAYSRLGRMARPRRSGTSAHASVPAFGVTVAMSLLEPSGIGSDDVPATLRSLSERSAAQRRASARPGEALLVPPQHANGVFADDEVQHPVVRQRSRKDEVEGRFIGLAVEK